MADVISAQNTLTVSFPSVGQSEQLVKSYSATPGSSILHTDEEAVPTTAVGTAVPLGPVSTPGMSEFVNVDPTNFCEVGVQVSGTFYPMVKLLPGGVLGSAASFYVADGVTLYYRGNTAPPRVEFIITNR